MTITTLHKAHGIDLPAERLTVPYGMTVEEMACATHAQLEGLTAWVKAPEGSGQQWIELPRHMWRHVRPKISDAVLYRYRLNDFARDLFAIAAAVLVSVAVPFIGAAVGGGILGTIVGGLAGAALGIGAQLAINALFPAQQFDQQGLNSRPEVKARQFAQIESDNNLLAKESSLPIVVGTRRISPPEIAYPHFYIETGAQAVRRIFALDGQHAISSIQIDRAPVEDFPAIETQVRDGAETSPVTTFVDKVTKPTAVSEQLTNFSLEGSALVDQEDPFSSEPRPVRFTTINDEHLEEISLRFQIDSLIRSDSPSNVVRLPVRIKFRPKGSTGAWFYVPEIHILGKDASTMLKEVRFRWDNAFGSDVAPTNPTYEFFQRVPPSDYALSTGQTGDQWQAHAHFVAGSGLRDVANMQGRRGGVRVTLDPAIFPKQEYEWEVVRGLAVGQIDLDNTNYEYAGDVYSLFFARYRSSTWGVPALQDSFPVRLTISQACTIVDRQPCQRPSTALVALKARGQTVRNVSALAARYVMDWDGTGWNTLTTTNNPATHYRQVLHDYLVYHGISTDLIANQQFVDWRQECIDRGYEVSAVFAGSAVREVLDAIAVAGYARPRFSDGFGIDWFRDRSAERPVQTFSPRNASITLEWVSGEKPMGIRATFQNAERDFIDDEIEINNPFTVNLSGYDVRSYDSIAKADLVRRRALFDMLQARYQQRRAWIVDASIEGLICDRGDLVGIVTDLMDDTNSGARVRKMIDSTTFLYDQDIPAESTVSLFGAANIFAPEDIFTEGERSLVLVSTPNGTEERTVVAAEQTPEGSVIRVDAPFSSTDLAGAHFVVGAASRFMHRCIVSEVRRKGEERAQLVLVDEAPEIYSTLYPPNPSLDYSDLTNSQYLPFLLI